MAIYFSIIGTLSLLSIFELFKSKRYKYFWCCLFIVCIIFLIVFAGTRYEVGLDYGTYYNAFLGLSENLSFYDFVQDDVIFALLCYLTKNFYVVCLLMALISISIVGIAIDKMFTNKFFPLLLYVGLFYARYNMGIMRQAGAIACCLWSINYIRQRKLLKFLLCILFGFCFHKSCALFLFVYPVYGVRIKGITYVLILALAVILGLTDIYKFIFSVLSYIPIFAKYYNYIDSQYINFQFSFNNIRRIVLMLSFLLVFTKRKREDKDISFYLLLYLFACIIFYAFRSFITFSDRGSSFFMLSEIFLFYNFMSICKERSLEILVVLIATLFVSLLVYNLLVGDSTSWMNYPYVPYRSWLFK